MDVRSKNPSVESVAFEQKQAVEAGGRGMPQDDFSKALASALDAPPSKPKDLAKSEKKSLSEMTHPAEKSNSNPTHPKPLPDTRTSPQTAKPQGEKRTVSETRTTTNKSRTETPAEGVREQKRQAVSQSETRKSVRTANEPDTEENTPEVSERPTSRKRTSTPHASEMPPWMGEIPQIVQQSTSSSAMTDTASVTVDASTAKAAASGNGIPPASEKVGPPTTLDVQSLLNTQKPLGSETFARMESATPMSRDNMEMPLLDAKAGLAPKPGSSDLRALANGSDTLILPEFDSVTLETSAPQNAETRVSWQLEARNGQEGSAELTRLLTEVSVWDKQASPGKDSTLLPRTAAPDGAFSPVQSPNSDASQRPVTPEAASLSARFGTQPQVDMTQTLSQHVMAQATRGAKEAEPALWSLPRDQAPSPTFDTLTVSERTETSKGTLDNKSALTQQQAKTLLGGSELAALQNRGDRGTRDERRDEGSRHEAAPLTSASKERASTENVMPSMARTNETSGAKAEAPNDSSRDLTQGTLERVRQNAAKLAAQGGGSAKIHINDSKVGQIDLEVKVGSGNSVHVEIRSRSEKVRAALEEHIGDLKESLGQHKLQLAEFKVVSEAQESRNQADTRRDGQPQPQQQAQSQQQSGQESRGSHRERNAPNDSGTGSLQSERKEKSSERTNLSGKTNVQRGANGSLKITA